MQGGTTLGWPRGFVSPATPQCSARSLCAFFFVAVAGPGTLSSAGIARVPGPSPLAAERGRVKGGERDPNMAQKAYFGVGRSPKEGFFWCGHSTLLGASPDLPVHAGTLPEAGGAVLEWAPTTFPSRR